MWHLLDLSWHVDDLRVWCGSMCGLDLMGTACHGSWCVSHRFGRRESDDCWRLSPDSVAASEPAFLKPPWCHREWRESASLRLKLVPVPAGCTHWTLYTALYILQSAWHTYTMHPSSATHQSCLQCRGCVHYNALLKPRGRVLHREGGGGWSGMAGRVASRCCCCCCRRPQLHLDRRAPNALHPLHLFLPGFGSSCQGWLSSNWPTLYREPCESVWEMGLGFETIAVPWSVQLRLHQ